MATLPNSRHDKFIYAMPSFVHWRIRFSIPFFRHLRLAHIVPCAALALALAATTPCGAAEIVVGIASTVTSLDPHFHNNASNGNIAEHFFDTLVERDAATGITSGLALSWTRLDPTSWEFKLRPDVRFHDGSRFTSADVLFSLARVRTIKHSPSSYAIYTRSIKSVLAVDPLTVRIITDGPAPMLPRDLASIYIVSKRAAEHATAEDFNSGKALIGTGPFKFGALHRKESIELIRNDGYWGKKPAWDKAKVLMLPNDLARTAALLSGRVDVIESVPTQDVRSVSATPDMVVYRCPSYRLMYLHLDSGRRQSPFVRSVNGAPLASNPLRDVRVRQAISKAIDRDAIVARVMDGMGEPSGQLVPSTSFGYVTDLRPQKADPAASRRLLAEAGYPNGFRLTIHSTNDHYVNDRQAAQAIAIMLTKAGIQTRVESLPSSIFFARANKLEFSFLLAGWNSDTGMAESAMKALLARYAPGTGMGSANRGRYDNPAFDLALGEALKTLDDDKRRQLLSQATRVAMGDAGIVPLYFQANVWAARKGLLVTPREDGRTYIHQIEPAPTQR